MNQTDQQKREMMKRRHEAFTAVAQSFADSCVLCVKDGLAEQAGKFARSAATYAEEALMCEWGLYNRFGVVRTEAHHWPRATA